MKIENLEGDLLDAFENGEVNALAHCCNCYVRFGPQIAAQIKNKYLSAYLADCDFLWTGDKRKLGKFSFAKIKDKIIYNVYGQYGYGGPSVCLEYDAFEKGLGAVRDDMCARKIGILGLPYKVGCGNAKGNWEQVLEIINRVFLNTDLTVKIYKLK